MGVDPPYYAVAFIEGGLADCLAGAVSAFYYAMLTKRAFRILGDRWAMAYRTKSIDWRDFHDPQYYQRLSAVNSSEVSYVVQGYHQHVHNASELYIQFAYKNLKQYKSASTTVVLHTNLGLTHTLFYNTNHMAELFRMGLRPETAFGCAINFLFEPWPSTMRPYAAIINELSKPAVLAIGIQIRVGDHALANQDANIDVAKYHPFFDCAEAVELAHQVFGQRTYWLLITDSLQLRRYAANRYPGKVLTETYADISHVGVKTATANGMRMAAADNWILALCQHFIISQWSGFGRTAVARSLTWGDVHILNTLERSITKTCNASTKVTYRQLASQYPPYL